VSSVTAAALAVAVLTSACGALERGQVNLPERTRRYPVVCAALDAESQRPIAGATCSIEGQSGQTDARGRRTFNVPAGERLFVVTAPGYLNGSRAFRADAGQRLEISIALRRSEAADPR
jgi:carboxypeptidase family protein